MVKLTSTASPSFGPRVGAAMAMLISVLVLGGWVLDIPTLRSLLPGAVQMKANAAVGLLLAGAGLWLRSRPGARDTILTWIVLASAGLLGAATLVEYAFHVDLGIDELLVTDRARAFNLIPGRMSPFTAWALVLMGTGTALLRRPAAGWLVLVCAGQVVLMAGVSLLGYAWGAADIVTDVWLPPIALNTGIALGALGLGLLAAYRQVHRHGASDPAPSGASSSERSLHLAFWGMLAMLALAMGHTYHSNLKFLDAAQSVESAQEVRIELANLHGCLQQLDSAQRRFARFVDEPSRLDIRSTGTNCRRTLQRLQGLTPADAEVKPGRLQALGREITTGTEALERLAATQDIAQLATIRPALLSEEARARMRASQATIQEMDAIESGKLALLKQSRASDRAAMLVSLMLTLAVSMFVFAVLTRNMRMQLRQSNASRENMESQKALLATVIESSPDRIVYKDLDGRVLGCNTAYAASVGRTVADMVGLEAHDYMAGADAEKVRLADAAVLSSRGTSSLEHWVISPHGTEMAIDVVRSPLRDHRGAITGVLAIGRDVTDRKRAEDATKRAQLLAEEAAQTKAAFLANMSHEMRTPLTGVLGMIDLLSAENLPAHQKKYVATARESGRHLLNVINDILDFSRIEKDKLQLESIDFSIPDLLEQLRSSVHPSAFDRGLALNIEIEPHSPPVVRGDPTRVKQVLLNLTGNAIKFTHAGQVRVSVRSGEPVGDSVRVVFEVRDTGVGIPDEKLSQLFVPFTQADASIARKYGGSGLGLAISQRLAEAMGGCITASSKVGEGSQFTFEAVFRIGDAQALQRPGSLLMRPAIPRLILVAEDVEVNRNVLNIALSRQGHRLVFAHDGAQAVAKVQQEPFDLVLMDVQMPVMDGIEATRRIRMMPGRLGQIPIVGLTANVMANEQERYLAAGMNQCLMKPIDWDQLASAIARHGAWGASMERPASVDVPLVEPEPAPTEASALDMAQMDSMRALVAPEKFAFILRTALDSVSTIIGEMTHAPTLESLGAHAHKLKGLAGTMGFATLSRTAGAIESAARAGRREEEMLGQLAGQRTVLHEELSRTGIPGVP